MQASDVAHCMQHWHVYTKWNERLFEEMYQAYATGRAEKDPSVGWYKGELWFFDNYIIPLAGKLRDCGVFGTLNRICICFYSFQKASASSYPLSLTAGVSSDEYLNYATGKFCFLTSHNGQARLCAWC